MAGCCCTRGSAGRKFKGGGQYAAFIGLFTCRVIYNGARSLTKPPQNLIFKKKTYFGQPWQIKAKILQRRAVI